MSQPIENPSAPSRPVTARSRLGWLIIAAAALLAAFASIVVIEELVSGRTQASPVSVGINLLTALAAVAGAVGYTFRQRWGTPMFGVSVLGHFTAHTLLIWKAIAAQRVTVYAIGGLAFIPVVSLLVLVAMGWDSRQRGRT